MNIMPLSHDACSGSLTPYEQLIYSSHLDQVDDSTLQHSACTTPMVPATCQHLGNPQVLQPLLPTSLQAYQKTAADELMDPG